MSDSVAPLRARWAAPLGVVLLALASSLNGIINGFTYDDRYIVGLNAAVHDLTHWYRAFAESYWPAAWGGDGYRPLTILMFKIQWALGHGSPMPFHVTNILLYTVVSVFVWIVARRLLPAWAAFLVAALFAVHPVHVEAVANVVGQSELWVAACLLPAVALYLGDRLRGPLRGRTAAGIIVLYLIGCLFKEHAIVLPAILGIAELTVLDGGRSFRSLLGDRRARIFYLSVAGVAIVFIAARAAILSDHGIGGFQPFTPFSSLKITRFQRTLTAVGVVPEWVRLFYWPASLSSEYGPPDIQIAQGIALWQLPGFLLLAGILSIGVLLRRREPVLSFAIGFVCVALLPSSNFIVPAGIVLAERTLFLPSVGAMLFVGGLAAIVARRRAAEGSGVRRERLWVFAATTVILAAGIGRSVLRTAVWQDNDTLFERAVVDSPQSYRAHYMLGAWLFEKGQKGRGEAEYHRALSLFPYDASLSFNMAEQYREVGKCGLALPLYQWTRDLEPDFPFGRASHAHCLLEVGKYAEAKAMALSTISAGGSLKLARRLIFLADSAGAADTLSRGNSSGTRGRTSVRLAGSPGKVP